MWMYWCKNEEISAEYIFKFVSKCQSDTNEEQDQSKDSDVTEDQNKNSDWGKPTSAQRFCLSQEKLWK